MLKTLLDKKGVYGVYLDGNALKVDFPYKGVGKKVLCRYYTLVFYCPLHQDVEVIPEKGDPYIIYIDRNGESEKVAELNKLNRKSLGPLIDEAYNCKDLKLLIWLKESSSSIGNWLKGNRRMPPKWVFEKVPREHRGILLERIRKMRPIEEVSKVLALFL